MLKLRRFLKWTLLYNFDIISIYLHKNKGSRLKVMGGALWYMRRTTLVKEQDRRRASDGLSSQTNGGLLSYLEAHSSLKFPGGF